MTNILKHKNKIIAVALAFVMVFGVLMFVFPTEAQAISLNATDTGFYNLAYGAYGQTTFGAGTQIRVINDTRSGKNKNDAVYEFDGATWSAVDPNKYIVWDGSSDNTFYGVYPYNAEYDSFTIPTDQSGGVQDADWMTDYYVGTKGSGNGVDFNFQHRLAKVTVEIADWNSEFDGAEKVITDPIIYSKGTDLTADYDDFDGSVTITSTGENTEITPLVDGTSYTAIVAPAAYDASDKFMTFTVDGQEMTVLAAASQLTEGLKPGNHYTFYLTVGKEAVSIASVAVNGWVEKDIDGGVAEEITEAVVSVNGKTADILIPKDTPVESVSEAIQVATDAQCTTIIVNGSITSEQYDIVKNGRNGAAVFFTDLQTDNYISTAGKTYTCTVGSVSDEKYVLIVNKWKSYNYGGYYSDFIQELEYATPGARAISVSETAWSVYQSMVVAAERIDDVTYLLLGDTKWAFYKESTGKWFVNTWNGKQNDPFYWFPVFDVPLS